MGRGTKPWMLAAAGAGGVILCAAVGGWALAQGFLRLNHPDRDRYPIQGLDASWHQGAIDWPRVKAAGWAFVLLKASEGGDWRDPLFKDNWQAARAAGFVVGAYHYYTFCKSGAAQAENLLSVLPAEAGALPPVVDVEFGGNCAARPSAAELAAGLAEFGEALRRHGWTQGPVLYVTRELAEAYPQVVAPPARLWVRSVFGAPGRSLGRWLFWQYANRGRVAGINGPVDLDLYAGSAEEWRALLAAER